MATVHREPNMVKWIGVRPGHNGEQVWESGELLALGNTLLYTVAAGKLLLLFDVNLSIQTSAASVEGGLLVYDAVPAIVDYFLHFRVPPNFSVTDSTAFWVPYEIPATYTVRLIASAAGYVYGGFHGVLIDV